MSAVNKVRSTTASGSAVYESSRAVAEYLLFHFGTDKEMMTFDQGPVNGLNFPKRCANISVAALKSGDIKAPTRVLDVGCAVGGSSFHLTPHFDEVVGVDFSNHFVDAAKEMKDRGEMEYDYLKQGSIFIKTVAKLPDTPGMDVSKVSFQQGDACNLSSDLGLFDVILASNLMCRLPNPRKFLTDVPKLLKPGGVLLLISPYSWLEEYTASSEWIGAGADGDSFSILQDFIETKTEVDSSFKMVLADSTSFPHQRENVPFLIREHERKYQYGVSDVTLWRKVPKA